MASNPPRVMASRYAPLILPQNLGDMTIDYQNRIPLFHATQNIIARHHVNRINDFFDLHEVEIEDVTMILFVQRFVGEV